MNRGAHAASPCAAVVLDGMAYRYPGESAGALHGIDLTVRQCEVVAIIGPSGAGKSTLLTLLDGRLRGWQGRAIVLGHSLDPRRAPPRRVRAETAFIFQEFALVDRASVARNVLNGRLGQTPVLASLFGRFNARDRQAVEEALRDTGILDLADKRADQISGGQRQRVGIARALAQEPRLMLADEPVSSLDPARAEAVLRLLTDAARARRATLIFSSHQPGLATAVADRIVALKEGRIALDLPAHQLDEASLADLYGDGERPAPLRLVG